MKILIIRFSSIGDIVLTTPVIRCVKQQATDAEVHYLTKFNFRSIVENNPYIDKLHLLNDNLDEVIDTLQKEQFDYLIDLHHNLRTLKVKRALKVKSSSFDKLNLKKYLLTAFKINLMPNVHIVDRYMDTVAALGVRNDGKGLNYFISKHDVVPDDHIPHSHSLGYVGVVIGAAHNTKKLPVHKLKELCVQLNYPIILLGGPEDRAIGDEIAAVDDVKIYNSCGKFTLNESADLVRRARLIVTHGSGLMHYRPPHKKPHLYVVGKSVSSLF